MLNGNQLVSIGYSYVKNRLQPSSPYGEELIRKQRIYTPKEYVLLMEEYSRLGVMAELYRARKAQFEKVERALMYFKDVRRSIERTESYVLTDVELFEIKRFLISLDRLVPAYDELISGSELIGIDIRTFPKALDIVDPDGMRTQTFRVSDCCSEELRKIRSERKKLDLSLRNAEKAEKESLNIAVTALAAREEHEEARIRSEMSKALSEYANELLLCIKHIGMLDHAMAKAKLCAESGGIIPGIKRNSDTISVSGMVNPMLDNRLNEKGRSFVPVSMELKPGSTVITGANMGGKSVTIKTLALSCMLALTGMPVFCERMELPLLSDIDLIKEDKEDTESGLSSFGGEMVRFNEVITKNTEGQRLILIDEFARGTNPDEGAALVRAAVRFFNASKDTFALLTTHFDDVACLAGAHYQVLGLKNADRKTLEEAMAHCENRMHVLEKFMDYGVYPVNSDEEPPKDALTICRALNVDESFMRLVED